MSDYYTDNQEPASERGMLGNADAMILANGQADAREIQDLKAAADSYQSQLDEMKALYQRTIQQLDVQQQRNAQITKSNAQTLARIQELLDSLSQKAEESGKIDWSAMEKHVDDAVYDAGRKTTDAVNDTAESLSSQISGVQEKIADLIQQSDDFSHKENVRVYRNVQAATDQLLQKQTEELRVDINAAGTQDHARSKASGISIAAFVVSLVTLAYVVCDSLGVVQFVLQLFQ